MGELKFTPSNEVDANQRGKNGYYLVQTRNGKLTCSCGRELVPYDENSWKCSGGYPIYRPEDGEFFKDKFGDVYLKIKDHDDGKQSDVAKHLDTKTGKRRKQSPIKTEGEKNERP